MSSRPSDATGARISTAPVRGAATRRSGVQGASCAPTGDVAEPVDQTGTRIADPAALLRRLGIDPPALAIDDVAHNRWLTPGIWRIAIGEQRMVLKCLAADRDRGQTPVEAHWTAGADDERRWTYWGREGLAYRHRLTEAYEPGGIVAPALVASDEDDASIVLLLEFAEGVPAEQWEIERYGAAAAALGRAQARFLTSEPVPSWPWLSRRFLRQYSSEKPADWSILEDDRAWAQPLILRNVPPELRELATWLHVTRDRLYEIAEALPRTLCHLDFWTKNLISRRDGTVVLLDWAFVGDGAVGEDIGNLVPDAVFDHFVPAERIAELETVVLDAHVSGLADGGWTGDPRLVELGMRASAVKYDWLTPVTLAAAAAPRQVRYGGTEEIDADYRFRERGLALAHNARSARRAIALADELGR